MQRRISLAALLLIIATGYAADDPLPHAVPDKEATRKSIDRLIAQFQGEKSKATLGLLEQSIALSISYGAPAWNLRDHEECCNFYIKTAQSLVDAFADKSAATPLAAAALADLKTALARAKDSKDVDHNAWIMRFAFDKTLLACDIQTQHGAALVALGEEYLARDDFDDAQDAFAASIALLPEMLGRDPAQVPLAWRIVHIASANALFGQKKYHEAAAAVVKGVELIPELARAQLDIRAAYGNPVAYESLISDLTAEARRNPNDAALQFLLGYEYFFTGEKEKARTFFEKTLTLDPKYPAANLFLNPAPAAPDTQPAKPFLRA